MVVVILTAGAAAAALRYFNKMNSRQPDRLQRLMFSIRQQAGVMGAICTAVFGILTALQSAKWSGANRDQEVQSRTGVTFGLRAGDRPAEA